MCLQTKWKKPKVAKRDIIVWKKFYNHDIYEHDLRSVCWSMLWTIGILYKTVMTTFGNEVNQGFHSFISKKELMLDSLHYNVIAKCIIPKGSLYYKGMRSMFGKDICNIVSNQLKILPINK